MFEYCDYIADRIQDALHADSKAKRTLIGKAGQVAIDLHPTEGWLQSTKKTIEVTDVNGTKYRVTVEAVE